MAPSQSDKKNQSGEKPKGKKICCACPETKKARDDCVTLHGPDSEECRQLIEDHKACLRAEGFNI